MGEDLPISGLPAAGTLTGTELFATVQNSTTKYTTLSSMLTSMGNNYGLYSQTQSSTPITNTIVESSLLGAGLGTLSVPANGFKVGDSFHATLTGHISSVNNHKLQIKVKANSVILVDTGAITLAGTINKHWKLEIYFTIRAIGGSGVATIVSGGNFMYIKDASTNFEGTLFSTETSTGFDTTVQNTLEITGQWDTSSTSDSIYSDVFILNKTF